MDKSSESLLRELYARFNTEPEYSISAPEYQKEQIDALVNDKLIERIDASSLTGWEYIIRPTYAGKVYFQNKKQEIAKYRRHLTFEWGKFLVPVLISIAALIVAIIK